MKKLFAIILTVAMLATMSITAFATDYTTEGDKGMTITYSVAPTYTVTIPTDVTINGSSTTISADDVVVEKGKYVSVSLDADNDFTVTTAQGATLTYTVTANSTAISAGDEILAVNPEDAANGSVTVVFAIDESAIQYAGTYTGTATFTVAVKDAPVSLISFTIDSSDIEEWVPGLTANQQAEAGMTWEEWIETVYNVDGYVVSEYDDYIYPDGNDWVAVYDTQLAGVVEPTDEIIADRTYNFLQVLG